ncbi:MAG: DNA topoisomerase [Thermoproteota archaeon]|nr:DNA topoisomerase [Thermoproteota archaeon]
MSSSAFKIQTPYSLVICEKPAAAQKIAQALGTAGFRKIYSIDLFAGNSSVGSDSSNKTAPMPSSLSGIPIFEATSNKAEHFVVCSALGHLYGLVDLKGNRNVYPVFDIKWMPLLKSHNGRKANSSPLSYKIEKTIKAISTLSKDATRFIHSCDYDQEGEVIGYNILEYACGNKYERSLRAKFSTLTDDEIRIAFDNLQSPSKSLADAGRSRHMIDFIYGVNLSRALTQSVRKSGDNKRYCNLSIGRVQGPTLAFVVDRETEINNHVPVPYWVITADFQKEKSTISTYYYPQIIKTQQDANSIADACRGQYGKVSGIDIKKTSIKAPHPFNLGDLQKEAYRLFRFSPSKTLEMAERLYLSALISYPRTSSQKLPSSIDYRKIISGIGKTGYAYTTHSDSTKNNNKNIQDTMIENKDSTNTNNYWNMAAKLLSKTNLYPNEGRQTDPAHPAIYPTGETPKGRLENSESRLLDLIIKRFFATFGEPAAVEYTAVTILVKGKHMFKAEGRRTTDEGWTYFYQPYIEKSVFENRILPKLERNDILKNTGITVKGKATQPPPRYNQSTLLEKMEREKIGTKATRSEIINTLFKRNYIKNSNNNNNNKNNVSFPYEPKETGSQQPRSSTGIIPTETGIQMVYAMRKCVPKIVSIELTRSMESELEEIERGNRNSESVIGEAKDKLKESISFLEKNQKEIGIQISNSILVTGDVGINKDFKQRQPAKLGRCPTCGKGDLIVKRSGKTKKRFAGCSAFSSNKCTVTAPLPQKGTIKSAGKTCEMCRWPFVRSSAYIRQEAERGERQWQFCLNPQCPLKGNKKPLEHNL